MATKKQIYNHMKIGFDAKRAVQNSTGLGNYSRYVIETLSNSYPQNEYLLFSPKRKENPRLAALKSMKNVHFIFPSGIWRFLSSFWRVLFIKPDLIAESVDIYHGLSNELPFGIRKTGIKSVVTIHDLIFIRYPEHYRMIERLIHRWKLRKYRYACLHADKIIAVSECTKRDIISFFNIPPDKIEVVYQGCHPIFSKPVLQDKKDEITKKYKLQKRFILYVGSIVIRKNLLTAVHSLVEVDQDVCLVAIGQKSSYQKKVETFIAEYGLFDRVFIYNHVPFDELPAFYQLASVFVLPSVYEGFGIPVIEALSSGLPVIAATGSCLEEAGGEHSLYVDPYDHQSLAKQINRVLNEPELASTMSEKGKQYVRRFLDQETAQKLLRVYDQVI
jgi:glycosyltransferase involved in cell wall biosynthesis